MKKNIKFYVVITILLCVILFVSYFMFYVHIPYQSYVSEIDSIRNEIVERDQLIYDNYFYKYTGSSTTYTMKVKENNQSILKAYDSNKKLISTYNKTYVSKESIMKKIKDTYKIDIKDLDICFDKEFVYFGTYQDEQYVYYFYYRIDNGKLLKYYRL